MTAFRWAVLGDKIYERRYRELNRIMSEQRPSEVEFLAATPVDFAQVLAEAQKKFSWIRLESPIAELALSLVKQLPFDLQAFRATDGFLLTPEGWWPRSGLLLACHKLLSIRGDKLDLSGEVLVVGAGAAARTVIAACARAGFRHINVTNKFDDQGLQLIRDLRRFYFGIEFEFVPMDKLVLLPGRNVLAINTTPMKEGNDLLGELTYLNFLRPDGMIWDFVIEPVETPLLREAAQIQVAQVFGFEIAAHTDVQWLEWQGWAASEELLMKLQNAYRVSVEKPDQGLVTKNGTPG